MNIIVLVSDTFRYDYLGCNGNRWIGTEELDRFARRAVCFDRHHLSSFPTIPNRTDLFTGRFSFPFHGWQPLDRQVPVMSTLFGDAVTVGVGSVLDAETARRAVAAGARYVVSPVFKPEIVAEAHRLDVPVMPGCFTPTEILTATEAGADVVKVFPADVFGPTFFKAVLAPMPHLRMMPTGGVSLTNAGDWIRAGAVAVGVGSALLDKQAIADGDWATLTQKARTLRASVEAGRASA